MRIVNLGDTNSILNKFVAELRDVDIQKDSLRFRRNVEPFHQGFLSYFDGAENAFVSAYRKYKDRLNFDIHIEYIASPRLTGKTLIISDPMLATGSSMELAYEALLTKGVPGHVHVASIISSKQALEYLQKKMPDDKTTIWIAALDNDLDDHSYIVPGLGDAGDLAFGEKE